MLRSLIQHHIKRTIRNFRLEGNSILFTLIKVFSLAYLCIGAWLFGKYYHEILLPGGLPEDQIGLFFKYFIYVMVADIFIRYYFQHHFFIRLQYYRHLPVNRTGLIIFNVIASPFNIANLVWVLFIGPFGLSTLQPVLGGVSTLIISVFLCLYLVMASYLVLLLRSFTNLISFMALLPWLLLSIVPMSKVAFRSEPGVISSRLFFQLLKHPAITLGIVLLACIVLLVITVIFVFRSQYYVTGSSGLHKSGEIAAKDIIRLTSLNSYLRLEMQMVFRNKRPLTVLIAAFGLALILGIPFAPDSGDVPFSFLSGVLMTGITGFMLGQYAFSTEAGYFEFIHSGKYKLEHLIKSKHKWYSLLSIVTATVIVLLSGADLFPIYLLGSSALFNVGIGFFIQLYAATYNQEKLPLQEFPLFSGKSVSLAQMIALILILVVPYFILLIMNSIIAAIPCLILVNIVSLYSLLHQAWWRKKILARLNEIKYSQLEGFRK